MFNGLVYFYLIENPQVGDRTRETANITWLQNICACFSIHLVQGKDRKITRSLLASILFFSSFIIKYSNPNAISRDVGYNLNINLISLKIILR